MPEIPVVSACRGYARDIAKHPGFVLPRRCLLYTCSICGTEAVWSDGWESYGTVDETYGYHCPKSECKQQFDADIAAGVIHDPDGSWRKRKAGRYCTHRERPAWFKES